MKSKTESYCLIICGPTASGKTDLSLDFANAFASEKKSQIINADIGQFYTPLSVGTAKPDWKNLSVKHHLFDIINEPVDLNVVTYKKRILQKVNDIYSQNNLPVAVGGSLFYIRSLFFPPSKVSPFTKVPPSTEEISPPAEKEKKVPPSTSDLWQKLYEIDPKRANAIHPNDTYRINRALKIWEKTGKKPSSFEPTFAPPFHSRIVFINPPKNVLYQRINKRTEIMMDGWIAETKKLQNTPWETFLRRKKLIGYPEIFDWIKNGENPNQMGKLIETIQQKTRNYAKRQITFWKKFRTLLLKASPSANDYLCKLTEIEGCPFFDSEITPSVVDNKEITAIIENVRQDLDLINK